MPFSPVWFLAALFLVLCSLFQCLFSLVWLLLWIFQFPFSWFSYFFSNIQFPVSKTRSVYNFLTWKLRSAYNFLSWKHRNVYDFLTWKPEVYTIVWPEHLAVYTIFSELETQKCIQSSKLQNPEVYTIFWAEKNLEVYTIFWAENPGMTLVCPRQVLKCVFRKIPIYPPFLTFPKCFSVTWQYEKRKYQVWRRSGARVMKKSCPKFCKIAFFRYPLRKSLVLLGDY